MPVDQIVAAIVGAVSAGATEAGKKVVGDAYDGVKALIRKRFGEKSEAVMAVEKLEAAPESEGRKTVLQEELEAVAADSDAVLMWAVETLLAKVREIPSEAAVTQTATGTGIAQAAGGSYATVNLSGGAKRDV